MFCHLEKRLDVQLLIRDAREIPDYDKRLAYVIQWMYTYSIGITEDREYIHAETFTT